MSAQSTCVSHKQFAEERNKILLSFGFTENKSVNRAGIVVGFFESFVVTFSEELTELGIHTFMHLQSRVPTQKKKMTIAKSMKSKSCLLPVNSPYCTVQHFQNVAYANESHFHLWEF